MSCGRGERPAVFLLSRDLEFDERDRFIVVRARVVDAELVAAGVEFSRGHPHFDSLSRLQLRHRPVVLRPDFPAAPVAQDGVEQPDGLPVEFTSSATSLASDGTTRRSDSLLPRVVAPERTNVTMVTGTIDETLRGSGASGATVLAGKGTADAVWGAGPFQR